MNNPLLSLASAYSSASESSEEEAETKVEETKERTKAASSTLPSADAIFETTARPEFLQVAKRKKQQVKDYQVQEYSKEEEDAKKKAQEELHAQAEAKQKPKDMKDKDDLPPRSLKRPLSKSSVKEDPITKSAKKNAKERVKTQRLRGQAGIGSDFRSWKSEGEMVLRQQFD